MARPLDAPTRTAIHNLPKAELHVHIEGTLEPSLAAQLAERNNVSAPREPTNTRPGSFPFHDLPSFLALYYARMSCLVAERDFYDLAMAYFRKAAGQNVKHAEVFFDPQAHASRGVAFGTVMKGLMSAKEEAERECGMSVGYIMCFLRDQSAESAMETLDTLLGADGGRWRGCVVGIGLDSDEKGNPPEKFAEVFKRVKGEGIKATIHCDVDQEDSIGHVRTCVRDMQVDRLDHGTNIVEDEGLVEEVRKSGIGLTCCPLSNSVLDAHDFKGKEMVELMRRGVRTTVNSDDPAYFGGYVGENLEKMVAGLGIGVKELAGFERNAFEVAWCGEKRKAELLRELEGFLMELTESRR